MTDRESNDDPSQNPEPTFREVQEWLAKDPRPDDPRLEAAAKQLEETMARFRPAIAKINFPIGNLKIALDETYQQQMKSIGASIAKTSAISESTRSMLSGLSRIRAIKPPAVTEHFERQASERAERQRHFQRSVEQFASGDVTQSADIAAPVVDGLALTNQQLAEQAELQRQLAEIQQRQVEIQQQAADDAKDDRRVNRRHFWITAVLALAAVIVAVLTLILK